MTKNNGSVRHLREGDPRPGSGISQVGINVLLLGLDLGWDATEMRNGSIRLTREHDGRQVQILIPTNQRSIKAGVATSWYRKIFTYADPMKVAFLKGAIENLKSTDASERQLGEKSLENLRSSEIILDPDALTKYLHREELPAPIEAVPDPEPEPEPAAEPEPEPVAHTGEATIHKIRPWIARHNMGKTGGEVYESRAVLERKWTDGTTDYSCAFDGCDYTHAEPRSVASHYGGRHGKDLPAAQRRQDMYIDPATSWTPNQRQAGRIARLTKELNAAASALEKDDKVVTAESLAQWIVQTRDSERDALSDETTSLSPEQVIERVRRLVDGGAYVDLMARVDQVEVSAAAKVEEMREQLSSKERGMHNALRAMEARLAEKDAEIAGQRSAVESAQRLEKEATERWTALRELVNGP